MPDPGSRIHFGASHTCEAVAGRFFLLLFSLSLLHSGLGSSRPATISGKIPAVRLLSSADPDLPDYSEGDDPIDELDLPDEPFDEDPAPIAEQDDDDDDLLQLSAGEKNNQRLIWDHVAGVARRPFDKRLIGSEGYDADPVPAERVDQSKIAFSSDDQPMDEDVRSRLDEIGSVEDVLLLKTDRGPSILRRGWATLFEKNRGFFRNRMFGSNLEGLNPLNNPLLQDPDMPGITGLTRGDKMMQKALRWEIGKHPFPFGGSGLERAGNGKTKRNRRTKV